MIIPSFAKENFTAEEMKLFEKIIIESNFLAKENSDFRMFLLSRYLIKPPILAFVLTYCLEKNDMDLFESFLASVYSLRSFVDKPFLQALKKFLPNKVEAHFIPQILGALKAGELTSSSRLFSLKAALDRHIDLLISPSIKDMKKRAKIIANYLTSFASNGYSPTEIDNFSKAIKPISKMLFINYGIEGVYQHFIINQLARLHFLGDEIEVFAKNIKRNAA